MHNAYPHSPNATDDPKLEALLIQLRLGRTRRYPGEPVSHLDHALQTARLAVQAKASADLVTAALLHDIGHLEPDIVDTASSIEGIDDRHEARGARRLAALFAPAVSEPVRLHVQAKRYLIATIPGYADRMSEDSRRSLVLQGGPMAAAECAAFDATPHAADALRLRCWDDLAKDPSAAPLDLDDFIGALRASRHAPGSP